MVESILIDAGPLIALVDSSDNFHGKVSDFLSKNKFRFISTLAVFTEVSHMLDFNVHAQLNFYEWVMFKGVIISDINQNDMPRILDLTKKYSDLPMDFADATLVVTSEKTRIRKIISLDKDFNVYRLPGKEKIQNVFYPNVQRRHK
ncbi:MAG: PIN domain-containing protein [Treponema sp.]|jgi:predicted nucleic acid-binding protein|nr:PIN domain-containing protein [Treponema sp.]